MSLRPTRRQVLQAGAAMGVGAGIGGGMSPSALIRALAAVSGPCSSLTEITNVIFLVQENRSFDHYFGRFKGVRGYDDRTAPGGDALFAQAYTKPATGYDNPLKPFRIDTTLGVHQGDCTNDIEHQWAGQHDSWSGGAYDNWMRSHLKTDFNAKQAALTMGYYQREDLPFHYALADNFTICDNYFCSVNAGTDVNRLYSLTGTLDPDGWDGGLQFLNTKLGTIENPGANLGTKGKWIPYPQKLETAGVSWKCYGAPDGHLGDNTLRYFPQFRPSGNPTLAEKTFASNAFPADFAADCAFGRLPAVSFLFPALVDTEHAPAPITWGEAITHSVLTALFESGLWKSSVLFLTYDENGGFFDHVPPPRPADGTAGEFLNQSKLITAVRNEATTVDGMDKSFEPIGLGPRVPMLVISPFSRNATPSGAPLVYSGLSDHTSMLRFLETWTAALGNPVPVPNRDPVTRSPGLSHWRRTHMSDLTGSLNMAAAADANVPTALVAMVPNRFDPRVLLECIVTGTPGTLDAHTAPLVVDPVIPSSAIPKQEPFTGDVQRPSGPVMLPAGSCPTPSPSPSPSASPSPGVTPGATPAPAGGPSASGSEGLPPTTTESPLLLRAVGGAALGASAWWAARKALAAVAVSPSPGVEGEPTEPSTNRQPR